MFFYIGLIFSPDESTALVQKEGGPCAVIAPIQAFLFRAILRDPELNADTQWRHVRPILKQEIIKGLS
jgi:hypothetical protein